MKDGSSAILVEPEKSKELLPVIKLLMNDPEIIKNLEEYVSIKSVKFTTENFAEQLSVIFKKIYE